MSPETRKLLGEKIEQLKRFQDKDEIAINARDLRAFGLDVPEGTPDGTPVVLTVGDLRQVASAEAVEPVVEDCGCPKEE